MKFEEMTSTALSNVDREQTLVVIPIAAVEQHGPHMPTGTDHILCTSVAQEIESRLPDQILITPTVWSGASAHHLRFGATLDTPLDTYEDVLFSLAQSLLEDNFQRLLFLNGHGGNIDPMRIVARKLQLPFPDTLIVAGCYWDVLDIPQSGILEGDQQFVGHACEFETSLMLHLRPELVDPTQLTNAGELIPDNLDGMFVSRDMYQRTNEGFTGRPDLATPEKGEKLFHLILNNLTQTTQKLLSHPTGLQYNDFLQS